jgi:Mn2+/Fe2+ NRAMP family transporter
VNQAGLQSVGRGQTPWRSWQVMPPNTRLANEGRACGLCSHIGIGPIQLLFASSIVAGLAVPITQFLMVLMARVRHVRGEHRIGPRLAAAGVVDTAIVTAASLIYLWQTFVP